eukprot:scaffold3457_cov118-Isochrysis_galbana.AAC.4
MRFDKRPAPFRPTCISLCFPHLPFWDFPVGTHFGRLDPLSRAWDAACRRQPPPSSSSWSARDRPWPRRRRPTRPWPDPRQVMRRPARATHAAPRRAFRQPQRLPLSHNTGVGWVAPHIGQYADALSRGTKVCLILVESLGGIYLLRLITKLRERVEANDGAPTAPAGAGGGGYGRGKRLEASPR